MLDLRPHPWCADVLESDRRYFEAGAERIRIQGAEIAVLRGAESLAAGCVVQRVAPRELPVNLSAWLSELRGRLCELRCRRPRIYLDAPYPELEALLARSGYRRRLEFGLARARVERDTPSRIELRPAENPEGWAQRRELMQHLQHSPDGHEADGDQWVALEQRKCAVGHLRPYLIVERGLVLGAVCSAITGSVLRFKNLFVAPNVRRRGVATDTAHAFAQAAADEGCAASGCFVVEGEPGLAAYGRAGYVRVVQQIEWMFAPEAAGADGA